MSERKIKPVIRAYRGQLACGTMFWFGYVIPVCTLVAAMFMALVSLSPTGPVKGGLLWTLVVVFVVHQLAASVPLWRCARNTPHPVVRGLVRATSVATVPLGLWMLRLALAVTCQSFHG